MQPKSLLQIVNNMISDGRHIIGLPVITRSGRIVGRVQGMQIDIDQHVVKNYVVVQGIIPLFGSKLLIDPSQVIEITTKQMLVVDGSELPNAESAAAE